MPRSLTLLLLFLLSVPAGAQGQRRQFEFRYSFVVKTADRAGQPIRIWLPLAQSDRYQRVKVTSVESDLPLRRTREKRFGNRMLYAAGTVDRPGYRFTVVYDVVRREHVSLGTKAERVHPARLSAVEQRLWTAPDKLVPTSGLPAELAARVTAGKATALEKARAIYDYVLANMRYDKSGEGWGRGDALYACDAKHGNCTDFHSLFIAMVRSQGIPARFEIGFPLPGERAGEVAGYHCWAEFYVDGMGWIPIDASQAWQHPEKRDYFFGAHDADRVQFTLGRDLVLSPAQQGPPLNYFVYPYVELKGAPYNNVSLDFSFADGGKGGGVAAAGRRRR